MPLRGNGRILNNNKKSDWCLFFDNSHSSYRMNDLMKFFYARRSSYRTDPKLLDDVIYTTYVYDVSPHPPIGDLLGIPELKENVQNERQGSKKKNKSSKFDTTATEAEVFMFSYGTIVIWGMTEAQEKRLLSSMYFLSRWQEFDPLFTFRHFSSKRFEVEKLGKADYRNISVLPPYPLL